MEEQYRRLLADVGEAQAISRELAHFFADRDIDARDATLAMCVSLGKIVGISAARGTYISPDTLKEWVTFVAIQTVNSLGNITEDEWQALHNKGKEITEKRRRDGKGL